MPGLAALLDAKVGELEARRFKPSATQESLLSRTVKRPQRPGPPLLHARYGLADGSSARSETRARRAPSRTFVDLRGTGTGAGSKQSKRWPCTFPASLGSQPCSSRWWRPQRRAHAPTGSQSTIHPKLSDITPISISSTTRTTRSNALAAASLLSSPHGRQRVPDRVGR
jgi:hypothetical protein